MLTKGSIASEAGTRVSVQAAKLNKMAYTYCDVKSYKNYNFM